VSSIRGRVVKTGGVVTDAGASPRTDAQQVTRPAFRFPQGSFRVPASAGGTGGGKAGVHPYLDTSSVTFWRLVIVGLAAAYIVGFHVSLNGIKLGIGPGRMGG
jgi:hypothetical protein